MNRFPARWRCCRLAEPSRGVGSAAALVVAFLLMGLTTRLFCADPYGYSSIWPANAAMLAALLVLRARLAVPVLLMCFGINVLFNRISGLSLSEGLLACVLNVVQSLLVAFPTRRLCGARTDLGRLRRSSVFGLIVLAATAVEAGIGVFVEYRFLGDQTNVPGDWLQWVLCDALGLMLAAPAVILLMDRTRRRRIDPGPILEPVLLLAAILLLTVVGFLRSNPYLLFFLYPAMVTLAFRTRPVWTLGTLLVVSILISALTAHGFGPIAQMSPDGSQMRQNMLQPYLWSLFLSSLPATIAVGEARRSALRLSRLRAHLTYAATHDQLTGLVSRQLFRSRLAAQLQSGAGGTLLFIDLDHFKQINDTLGHQAGDTVLRAFSERMTGCARSLGGEAARLGGDEFAMLVPAVQKTGTVRCAAEMVLATARTPYHTAGGTVRLTISVGGASLGPWVASVDDVVRRADEALYAAKHAGRDTYRLHGQPERRTGTEAAIPPRSASGSGRPASRW